MTDDFIRQQFRRAYGGPFTNFITPDIVEYGETGEHYYELSKERHDAARVRGIGPIYGVTVITKSCEKSALSTCFDNMQAARKYAKELP